MRRTARRQGRAGRAVVALALASVVVLGGCGAAAQDPAGARGGPTTAAPTPVPTVATPADGVSLSALGFENGPADRVFVPFEAQVSSRVDQPNNVTLVLTSPSAADLLAFYRRTVTANGFTVTADDPSTTTLAFTGLGWTGTFTGDARASALLLRPAT